MVKMGRLYWGGAIFIHFFFTFVKKYLLKKYCTKSR